MELQGETMQSNLVINGKIVMVSLCFKNFCWDINLLLLL